MVKGDLNDVLKEYLKTSSQPSPPRVENPIPNPVPKFESLAIQEDEGAWKGTDYVDEFRRKQQEEFMSHQQNFPLESTLNDETIDVPWSETSSVTDFNKTQTVVVQDVDADVLQKYNLAPRFQPGSDVNLPVLSQSENIIDQIRGNAVTVITGPTGCGKTTMIPLFILQDHQLRRTGARIVVTQPRRIAAQSVARRVADNLGVRLGTLVGYKVGLDKENCSSETLLLYCTTGILKKTIIGEKSLTPFTHIILDEVHDREEDMDFLLLLCKHFVNTNSRGVKIVLMSASLDSQKLIKYFTWRCGPFLNRGGASSYNLRLNSAFGVQEFYMDDLLCSGVKIDLRNEDQEPFITEQMVDVFEYILGQLSKKPVCERSAVLVFLPGEGEISRLKSKLEQMTECDQKKWWILPLHSRVPLDQLQEVFHHKPGFRKIILATNIAESSITIPDVEVVIDFCLSKNLVCDPKTNCLKLKLEWIDGNNALQRKGRCGRTCEGRVYRLVSKMVFCSKIKNYRHLPEIQRIPLEKAVLDSKMLDFGSPKEVLALAIDPPNMENMCSTVMRLKEIGALLITANGVETQDDGDLTVLGEILSSLPLDVVLGKLVVYGFLLGVLEECVIIAAGLSSKSIFTTSSAEGLTAHKNKLKWANNTFSDCLAVLYAFKSWKERCQNQFFKKGGGYSGGQSEKQWCIERSLQLRALREMDATVADIMTSLRRLKIFDLNLPNLLNENGSSPEELFIQIAIFGAFYPNYIRCAGYVKDMREVFRQLHCHSYFSTVYLTGLTPAQSQHAVLYENQIKEAFSKVCHPESIKVHFEDTKIIVGFTPKQRFSLGKEDTSVLTNTITGDILPEVYIALKMAQLREFGVKLKIYPDEIGNNLVEKLREIERRKERVSKKDHLSAKDIGHVKLPFDRGLDLELEIQHIESPNSFWVIYSFDRPKFQELKSSLKTLVDDDSSRFVKSTRDLRMDRLYLVVYEGAVFRAFILKIGDYTGLVHVKCIDVGTHGEVEVQKIWAISQDDVQRFPIIQTTPALAFECSLARIKPKLRLENLRQGWDLESNQAFIKLLRFSENSRKFWARVACILPCANGPLVHIQLFRSKNMTLSLNDEYLQLYDKYGSHFAMEEHDNQMTYEAFKFDSLSENLKEPHKLDEDKASKKEIYLRGPSHPLESSGVALTSFGRTKKIRIEQDSVNSVFVNRYPTLCTDQWIVCSHLASNQSGNILIARSTTCMPVIHGLGSILVMAFAPRVELRVDSALERYVGCIAGLGSRPLQWGCSAGNADRQKTPYYSIHDMEIPFDVMFDNTDIERINMIRSAISKSLSRPFQSRDSYGLQLPLQKRQEALPKYAQRDEMISTRYKLRKLFEILLFNNRTLKSKESTYDIGLWNCLPPSGHLIDCKLQENEDHILPTFCGVKISNQYKPPEY